ncbi:MAG: acyl-CoA dehydrogenase family protein [Alphaproteobacteria bacterium]|nr:acyl-CoA dehydrogenase family protein [Alphaproteobacteria bacterium]
MDFELSEDQRLLKDSISRLLSDNYSFAARRGYMQEANGWSRKLWDQYAELGLLGLPIEEKYGGFGGGPVDVMLVMEEFGKVLALEPFLASIVLGTTAVKLAGSEAQKSMILPAVAAGQIKLAFAHGEQQARHDITDVLTTAKKEGNAWLLNGAKSVVLHGDCADKLIVSARTAGERHDAGGLSLFLVDGTAAGLVRRGYALRDGSRAAELAFTNVRGEPLGAIDGGLPVIERVIEAGIAAMAAEVIGCMETTSAMTLDYLKTRQQFGKAIGQNQVMQHKAADMLMSMEQGRSMCMLAAMMVDEEDREERTHNISLAKVGVGQAGRAVTQAAVQMHGGIGMTEEYAVGHYFRRVMTFEHLWGDCAWHLAALAAKIS